MGIHYDTIDSKNTYVFSLYMYLKQKKNVLLGLHYGKIFSVTFPNSNVAINILSPPPPSWV